jgi:hypothetical protein
MISPNTDRDEVTFKAPLHKRIALWIAVVAAALGSLVILIVSLRGAHNVYNYYRGLWALRTFIVTLVATSILAVKEALSRAEHEMTFVLSDKYIVRKRDGFEEVRIDLSDISRAREGMHRLIIVGKSQSNRIAVPRNINEYPRLLKAITQYQNIETYTLQRRDVASILWTVLVIACWFFAATSGDRFVIVLATSLGTLSSGFWFYKLYQSLRWRFIKALLAVGISTLLAAIFYIAQHRLKGI